MVGVIVVIFTNFLFAAVIILYGLLLLFGVVRRYTFHNSRYSHESVEELEEEERKFARTHNLDAINNFIGKATIISTILLIIPAVLYIVGVVPSAIVVVFWIIFFFVNVWISAKASGDKRFEVSDHIMEWRDFKISEHMLEIKTGEDALDSFTRFGDVIPFAEITDIQLTNSLPDNLEKTDDSDMSDNVYKGTFRSGGAEIKVYADKSKPPFIRLETKSGPVIFNDDYKVQTRALYKKLRGKMAKVGKRI